MLDERLLDDRSRCPGCATRLPVPRTERCRECSIRLTGPDADRLWMLSVSVAGLLRQRQGLLHTMRLEATYAGNGAASPPDPAPPRPPAVPLPTTVPVRLPHPSAPAGPTPARPPVSRDRVSAEVGRRRVARIVLGAGVLMMIVAAIVFVAVTWRQTGTTGRALVMAFALVVAAGGTALAERRELPATAEAMAAMTVAMGLLDGYAAWAADLGGLRGGSALLVTAGTLAAVGGAAALGSMLAPLRALRISAALLLQGPLPLFVAWFGVSDSSLLPLAVGLALQAAVDVVLLRWTHAKAPRGLRIVAEVGVLCYWLAAVGLTLVNGAGAEGGSGPSAGTMPALAALAGGIAYVLRGSALVRHIASGGAMAGALAALGLVLAARPDGDDSNTPIAWVGVWLLIPVALGLGLLFAVPRPFRSGPITVLGPLTVAPAFWALVSPPVAGLGPLSWVTHAWTLDSGATGARDTVVAGEHDWDFGFAPLALLPLWVVIALLAVALTRGRPSRRLTITLAAIGIEGLLVVGPPALDLPLWAASGWHLGVGVALACGWRVRAWLPAVGGFHLLLAVAWSTAHESTSIVVWALAALGFGVAAVASPDLPRVRLTKPGTPTPSRYLARPFAAGAAVALACVDAAMAARHAEASLAVVGLAPGLLGALAALVGVLRRPDTVTSRTLVAIGGAAWAVGNVGASDAAGTLTASLVAALVVGVVGAIRDVDVRRRVWAGAGSLSWVGVVAAGAYALGADHAVRVLAALVAAGLLFPLATLLSGRPRLAVVVEGTAGVAVLIALTGSNEVSPAGFAVAAAATLYGALFGRTVLRPGWAPATGVLLYAATAATLYRLDVDRPGHAVAGGCAAGLLLVLATFRPAVPRGAVAVEGVACAAAIVAIAASGELLPVALGIVAAAVLHSACRGHTVLRPGWAPAAAVLVTATVPAALYQWSDIEPVGPGLAAVAVAAAGYVVGTRLPRVGLPTPLAAAACALVATVATVAVDPEQTWLPLTVTGLAALTTPRGPLRLPAHVAAVPLLFTAYWIRMALFGVEHPEAYTLPPAFALLAEGLLRRRAKPDTNSWAAYGGPIAVLLLPSLPPALVHSEPIRPSLLGAAAIVTLLLGARFRLQAPLFQGAAVLATVTLVHLLPHLAPVYDAVPRWAILATAGLLLILTGAGYERRLRDLKRLRQAVSRLN